MRVSRRGEHHDRGNVVDHKANRERGCVQGEYEKQECSQESEALATAFACRPSKRRATLKIQRILWSPATSCASPRGG